MNESSLVDDGAQGVANCGVDNLAQLGLGRRLLAVADGFNE